MHLALVALPTWASRSTSSHQSRHSLKACTWAKHEWVYQFPNCALRSSARSREGQLSNSGRALTRQMCDKAPNRCGSDYDVGDAELALCHNFCLSFVGHRQCHTLPPPAYGQIYLAKTTIMSKCPHLQHYKSPKSTILHGAVPHIRSPHLGLIHLIRIHPLPFPRHLSLPQKKNPMKIFPSLNYGGSTRTKR